VVRRMVLHLKGVQHLERSSALFDAYLALSRARAQLAKREKKARINCDGSRPGTDSEYADEDAQADDLSQDSKGNNVGPFSLLGSNSTSAASARPAKRDTR
jgi:hypothetical protein